MKKLINAILVIVLVSACSDDFLEEVPKDRLTEANFYNTREDAIAAVYAIYDPIRQPANNPFQGMGTEYWAQLECMSDYATGRGSYIPVGQYQGLNATNAGRTSNFWSYFYQSINLANIAISRIADVEMNEDEKLALIAEAKFLRAFCYYHLVVNWDAVPLFLEPVENASEASKARTPAEDIYSSIISDLQDAEEDLPSSINQQGRPSAWSAKSLLAHIYLVRENWSLAKEKAGEVINSGQFSLVEVGETNDFDNLFSSAANGTSEEIFYLKFNNEIGNTWPFFMNWNDTEFSPYGAFVLYSLPSYPFISNWDDDDLRKKYNIFSEYKSRKTGEIKTLPESTPILCSKFRDPGAPGMGDHGTDYPITRYAEVLLIYAEAAAQDAGGPTTEAVEYLNMVKRRAYGYPSQEVSPVDYPTTGWTAASFQETILQERGYEFYMEGKRWHDLKRTNTVQETILSGKGITVLNKHLLWPIPQSEIDVNELINQEDQNPGY